MEKNRSAIERRENSTNKTDNEGFDINNEENDVEEEKFNGGNSEYDWCGALPDMNARGDGMDDPPARRGGTEEEVDSTL